MRYALTLPVEKDTSSNGSVIGRRVHRRFFCGICHREARAQAILLREMSLEGMCIGDSLAGYVIKMQTHRRCFCGICHREARA